jgi:polyisoprenoid-binding protein YceI
MPLVTQMRAFFAVVRHPIAMHVGVGVCLLSLQLSTASAQGVDYALDPAHTRVHWEVSHFGTSTSRGRFGDIRGSVTLDARTGTGEVSIALHTASVDTGVAPLDAVLRRSYLASEQHPLAYFVASGWRWKRDAPLEVPGELTLLGVSRPLRLQASALRCHTHPLLQREVCGADLQAQLVRSEFGITDGLPFIGDTVRLQIQVEAIRQAPP